jgi:hypothetical protein
MRVTRSFISTVGAGLLASGLASGAIAQSPEAAPPPNGVIEEIQKSVVEAIEIGLKLLSVGIGKVLPYKLPEVLPNGDIIIRYSPPPAEKETTPAPAEGQPHKI